MNIHQKPLRAAILATSIVTGSLPLFSGCAEAPATLPKPPAAGNNFEKVSVEVDILNEKIAKLVDEIEKKVFAKDGFSGHAELKMLALNAWNRELKIIEDYAKEQILEFDQVKAIKRANEILERLDNFSLLINRVEEVSKRYPEIKALEQESGGQPSEDKPPVEDEKPKKEEKKKQKRQNRDWFAEVMYA